MECRIGKEMSSALLYSSGAGRTDLLLYVRCWEAGCVSRSYAGVHLFWAFWVGWVAWVGVDRGFVLIDGACCSSLGFCSWCVRARVCAFAFARRVQIQEGSIYCLSLF